MGINYTQKCIVGFVLSEKDITVIDQEQKVEQQPRYNTKTGEVSHMETVVIQEEKNHLEFYDLRAEDAYDLSKLIAEKYDIDSESYYNGDEVCIWVGRDIGETENYGRVDMLYGEVGIDELMETVEELRSKFDESIGIHFIAEAG